MNGDHDNEPRIFVDEDWKQRVERERAQESQAEKSDHAEAGHLGQFPPASFEMLVSVFSSQALMGLGYLVDPQTGQGHADYALAKHAIDMLAVVQEKTRGNLTAQEIELLEETLHQLRLAFVAQTQSLGAGGAPPASGLELP